MAGLLDFLGGVGQGMAENADLGMREDIQTKRDNLQAEIQAKRDKAVEELAIAREGRQDVRAKEAIAAAVVAEDKVRTDRVTAIGARAKEIADGRSVNLNAAAQARETTETNRDRVQAASDLGFPIDTTLVTLDRQVEQDKRQGERDLVTDAEEKAKREALATYRKDTLGQGANFRALQVKEINLKITEGETQAKLLKDLREAHQSGDPVKIQKANDAYTVGKSKDMSAKDTALVKLMMEEAKLILDPAEQKQAYENIRLFMNPPKAGGADPIKAAMDAARATKDKGTTPKVTPIVIEPNAPPKPSLINAKPPVDNSAIGKIQQGHLKTLDALAEKVKQAEITLAASAKSGNATLVTSNADAVGMARRTLESEAKKLLGNGADNYLKSIR